MNNYEPLSGAKDPRVVAFLGAWHANGRDFWNYENIDYDEYSRKRAISRRKYVLLDCGTSGVFMVEKATGNVFGIKAYGSANRKKFAGTIEMLTEKYAKATVENRAKLEGRAPGGPRSHTMCMVTGIRKI